MRVTVKGGQDWAENASRLANELEENCERGVRHGLRVPLVNVVVPMPNKIGGDHCGSDVIARHSADFHLLLGEIGITAHLDDKA